MTGQAQGMLTPNTPRRAGHNGNPSFTQSSHQQSPSFGSFVSLGDLARITVISNRRDVDYPVGDVD